MILSLKWDHCLLLWFVLMCSPSVVDIVHTFGCNKSEVPTHTHAVCFVSTGVFVLHTVIFGYQSLFVCVCVRVQFGPLNSFLLVWPPMDALWGLSHHPSDWCQSEIRLAGGRKKKEKETRREERRLLWKQIPAQLLCSVHSPKWCS